MRGVLDFVRAGLERGVAGLQKRHRAGVVQLFEDLIRGERRGADGGFARLVGVCLQIAQNEFRLLLRALQLVFL